MLIIGFGGPAEHGKSTCAKMAEDWFVEKGLTVKVISFADRLKEVCKIIFRLTDRDVNSTIGKVTVRAHLGTTPREILQKFGTEVCRESISRHLPEFTEKCGSTIWTWNVRKDIEDLYEEGSTDVVLIPDVRFQDELDMLRNLISNGDDALEGVEFNEMREALEEEASDNFEGRDFIFVNVIRRTGFTGLNANDSNSNSNSKSNPHISEQGLANPDYVIENDGTLESLAEKINRLLLTCTYLGEEDPSSRISPSSY